jgi:Ca-activated chloride channel family protein
VTHELVRGGWRRLLVLGAATIVFSLLGVLYPVLMRGPELAVCFKNLFASVPRLFGWGEGPDVLALSWRHPIFLIGLLALPFVFWRATLGEDRRVPSLRLGTLRGLQSGPRGFRVWLRDVPGVIRVVALGLFVTAMAGPLNALRPQTTDEEGIDAVVVIDLSLSMRAVLDNVPDSLLPYIQRKSKAFRPTRLDVAKAVIRDFISRRKTDRVGVVVFGKSAFVLSPTTLDYQLLDALVAKLELELIDGRATAIGDAVGVAVARLRHSSAKSKAVILLTDGDNNAGKIAPDYAARLANKTGVKLYTVLIGSGEWATVQDGFDLFGTPRYVHTQQMPANPALLERLAKETGGEAYVATDATALKESLHQVLNELEKTKFTASYATFEELFRFLLLPGVLLLALEAGLRSLVLRRFP